MRSEEEESGVDMEALEVQGIESIPEKNFPFFPICFEIVNTI